MSYHDCKFNCGATDCPAPTRILKKEMSLREDLRKGRHDGFNREVYDEDLDEIINQILDAVETNVEEIRISELSLQMGIPAECQEVYCEAFLELINKLRESE